MEVATTRMGEVVLAVVCDGVGGLSYGDLASATVTHAFVEWFESSLPATLPRMGDGLDAGLVEAQWSDLLGRLNDDIRSYGRDNGKRLGTTFTGLLACAGSFVAGHVGDSRLYRVGRESVSQITVDQTLEARRGAGCAWASDAGGRACAQNVILQAVGASEVLRPAFATGTFRSSDMLVLCTDGAYRRLDEAAIRSAFGGLAKAGGAALSEACLRFVDEGFRRGNTDNATVVCVRGDLVGPLGRGKGRPCAPVAPFHAKGGWR